MTDLYELGPWISDPFGSCPDQHTSPSVYQAANEQSIRVSKKAVRHRHAQGPRLRATCRLHAAAARTARAYARVQEHEGRHYI